MPEIDDDKMWEMFYKEQMVWKDLAKKRAWMVT